MLPYFLRHYTQFADVFLINHGSTDRTIEIAARFPRTQVLDFPYDEMTEERHSQVLVDMYKEHSKDADWVICVDADEFIYPNLKSLQTFANSSIGILKPQGYMMISENLPTKDGQIYDEIKTGVRMEQFDKPVIVDPKLDLTFGDGRHSVQSEVTPVSVDLKLLHYKYLSRKGYFYRSLDVYPRRLKDPDMITYRLKKGLDWYDRNLPKAKNVI